MNKVSQPTADAIQPRKQQVVVSLTSFPAAIMFARKAVLSILKGSVLPDRIVLYLTFSQFENKRLPAELTALTEQYPIFEIRNYDNDIRSYRKLVPALNDFPDAVIVTIDDDVDYHPNMLAKLLEWHEKYPNVIWAHRAKRIALGKPYRKWHKYHWYNFLFKGARINFHTLQTGCGGVLYPPHSLRKELIDERLFTRIAPTTDDIWFWAAAVANHVPVAAVPFGYNKPRDLGKPNSLALKMKNFKLGTDRNVAAMNALIELYPEILDRLKDKPIR